MNNDFYDNLVVIKCVAKVIKITPKWITVVPIVNKKHSEPVYIPISDVCFIRSAKSGSFKVFDVTSFSGMKDFRVIKALIKDSNNNLYIDRMVVTRSLATSRCLEVVAPFTGTNLARRKNTITKTTG